MNGFSGIGAYILAIGDGKPCMSRSDTEACRLYAEDCAEFCRGNDNRRFGEMFQVDGDNFRAIFAYFYRAFVAPMIGSHLYGLHSSFQR